MAGRKILVADDDDGIRDLMTLVLDMAGYSVCAVNNGREVADMVHAQRPDVILLDAMLGDMDGRDICKALKNDPDTKNIPVIIVSASHGWHTVNEKRCGANNYIAKPFDIDDLVEQVQRFAA